MGYYLYYLVDGIYPPWAIFVKTVHRPKGDKISHFAMCQRRFAIVRDPGEYWKPLTLWQIMRACVILHNMIIEDERENPEDFRYLYNGFEVESKHNPK